MIWNKGIVPILKRAEKKFMDFRDKPSWPVRDVTPPKMKIEAFYY
jgi:hypothetical protein